MSVNGNIRKYDWQKRDTVENKWTLLFSVDTEVSRMLPFASTFYWRNENYRYFRQGAREAFNSEQRSRLTRGTFFVWKIAFTIKLFASKKSFEISQRISFS
jgi:hypothetical protein